MDVSPIYPILFSAVAGFNFHLYRVNNSLTSIICASISTALTLMAILVEFA